MTAAKAADKPWLASYPEGIPGDIGQLEDRSLGHLLEKACKTYADRPAFACMGKTISYGALLEASSAIGAYLQKQGLKPGARVALMMPNVLQYPVAMMAVLRAGYVVVNVNPLYTPRELEHQLNDSGAEAIIILENFAATLEAVIKRTPVKTVVVASMGDMLGGLKGMLTHALQRSVMQGFGTHLGFGESYWSGFIKNLETVCVDGIPYVQVQPMPGYPQTGPAAPVMVLTAADISSKLIKGRCWRPRACRLFSGPPRDPSKAHF